ncbi:LCP family protein [Streptomyces cacaoi]|uniref:LCP family protein n=1 Tax=Streptomyces cacaoi TaxID=1898 RepID=UPI00333241B4
MSEPLSTSPPVPDGPPAHRHRRLRRLALLCAAGALLTTGVTAAPAGPARGVPDPRGQVTARPLNLLLVGLDTREGLTKRQRDRLHVGGTACECTDVMMLLHLSADRRRASLVSIPRDSWVRFAPHREKAPEGKASGPRPGTHQGKINAAHRHGGPQLTVRTVEQATGVDIDHYLETDFAGFVRAVDRLGGAPVCTREDLHDANSGLAMPAGSHHTDGREALHFVRARHVQPPGDLGRVRRQQQLMAGMMRRLTDPGITGRPARLLDAVRALRGTVRTDPGLTAARLVEIGRSLRGLDGDHMEFATVPIEKFDHRVPGWGSTLVWDAPRARLLFRTLRADRPLRSEPRLGPPPGTRPVAADPARIAVRVRGAGGAGDRMARRLRDTGFDVAARHPGEPGQADGMLTGRTEIRYAPDLRSEARALATALPGAVLVPVPGHGGTFVIRPGLTGTRVVRVVHDRSSVEGAPASATALACDPSGGLLGPAGE